MTFRSFSTWRGLAYLASNFMKCEFIFNLEDLLFIVESFLLTIYFIYVHIACFIMNMRQGDLMTIMDSYVHIKFKWLVTTKEKGLNITKGAKEW